MQKRSPRTWEDEENAWEERDLMFQWWEGEQGCWRWADIWRTTRTTKGDNLKKSGRSWRVWRSQLQQRGVWKHPPPTKESYRRGDTFHLNKYATLHVPVSCHLRGLQKIQVCIYPQAITIAFLSPIACAFLDRPLLLRTSSVVKNSLTSLFTKYNFVF